MSNEKESEKKQPFENAIEVVLSGAPEIILPLIRRVADELRFGDEATYFLPEEAGIAISTAFAKLQIQLVPKIGTFGSGGFPTIGIITLQQLPNKETTLFRVPPRSQWAVVEAFNFDSDGSHFTRFLTRLFTEFQRLGFVDFKEKPPLGFRLPHREKRD